MTHFGWQDALVVLAGLGALGWLVRRTIRARRSGKVCASCPSAESGACAQGAAPAPVMIQIGGIQSRSNASRAPGPTSASPVAPSRPR